MCVDSVLARTFTKDSEKTSCNELSTQRHTIITPLVAQLPVFICVVLTGRSLSDIGELANHGDSVVRNKLERKFESVVVAGALRCTHRRRLFLNNEHSKC